MLKNQIAKSNNGIERSKYITFGLPAEGIAEARPRLERVEADVTGNLKRLGVPSAPMDGQERLALLHSQMHPGSREPFRFSWQDIPRTGRSFWTAAHLPPILRSRKPRAMSGWVLLWMSGTFITISRMKQSRWGICPAWVISIAPAFQRKRSV